MLIKMYACVCFFCVGLNAQEVSGTTVMIYPHGFGVFVGADSKAIHNGTALGYPVCKIHEINGFVITHVGQFRMGGFSPIRIAKSVINSDSDIFTASMRFVRETTSDLKRRMSTGEVSLPQRTVAEPYLRVFIVKPSIDTIYSVCSFTVTGRDTMTYFSSEVQFVRWDDKKTFVVAGEHVAIDHMLGIANPLEKATSPQEIALRIKQLITIQTWVTPEIVGEPIYVVRLTKNGDITWLEKEQDCANVE